MTRQLKNWIDGYMLYTQHSEAPEEFHKWTAIGTIAGALRRRVWFHMGYFSWYPNFFMFFVAPPGVVSKSTTISLGVDILREVPGIHFGPSSITWQALIRALENAQEDVVHNDEFNPMACLTIPVTELGTFLDPRNREMIDVLVDLWDGKTGAWEKVTKTGSSEMIVNPWIHIMGCTTPSWIAENFGDYFFGGGLASRSVMIYADRKRELIAYPHRRFDDKMGELKSRLIHDLIEISNLYGQFDATEEAYNWGELWYKRHWNEDEHSHIEGDKFKAYLARKQTHIHKVAMILSVCEDDDLIIEKRHLEQAEKEVTVLEYNMGTVYGKMNTDSEMVLAADVLSFIRGKHRVNTQVLYREFYRTMTYKTYQSILESLAHTGLIKSGSNEDGFFVESVNISMEK
jgi:hypothetical protein